MKTKIIASISIAAALGATAVGATLVCKPTLINKVVYSKNVSSSKTAVKETVTLFIPMTTIKNNDYITKDGKKYTSETYSGITGKLMSVSKYINQDVVNSAKNKTFLGQAIVKKANTNGNLADMRGNVFNIPCTKVEVKLPIGTKLNVLWTASTPTTYDKATNKSTMIKVAAVEYNGEVAFISDDYLNLDNVATGEAAMKLVSKNQLKDIHYIGQGKGVSQMAGNNPLTGKPFPVMMTVNVNGMPYNYNILGKTVNVISYGKTMEYHLTPNEMMGETFGPATVGGQTLAKVEYDGMVGYISNQNLSNAPNNQQ